jgi:hypothetical protein
MRELFKKTNGWTNILPTEDGVYAWRTSRSKIISPELMIVKNGDVEVCNEIPVKLKDLVHHYDKGEWFKIEDSKTFNIKLTWWDFWFGLFGFCYFLIATYGSCNTPT